MKAGKIHSEPHNDTKNVCYTLTRATAGCDVTKQAFGNNQNNNETYKTQKSH